MCFVLYSGSLILKLESWTWPEWILNQKESSRNQHPDQYCQHCEHHTCLLHRID